MFEPHTALKLSFESLKLVALVINNDAANEKSFFLLLG